MASAAPPPADPVDPSSSGPNQRPATTRNPLRRSSDRTESTVTRLLVGLWLLAVPLAVIGGFLWWQQLSAEVIDQQGDRTQVVAVTTTAAPDVVVTQRGVPLTDQVPVEARWVGSTGAAYTGTILVSSGLPVGATQQIWIGRDGALTDPPLDPAGAAVTVLVSTGGLLVCWGALLHTGLGTVRFFLNRRRMADWDFDWQRVEPGWSGRHPAP